MAIGLRWVTRRRKFRNVFSASLRRVLLAAGSCLGAWVLAGVAIDLYGGARTAVGTADAIVVPGAAVWRGGIPSKALARRTLAGVEQWKDGRAPLLVLTGGAGMHEPAEAIVAARIAREHGVPESALVL